MAKIFRLALLGAGAMALLSATVLADTGTNSDATLRNTPAMHVAIKAFGADAKNADFKTQTFRTDVELKLRLAGIGVLSADDRLDATGQPYIYLNITPLHDRRGDAASYGIQLEFRQTVPLVRDPSVAVDASTWSIGLVGYGRLANVRGHVRDMMDTFINVWLGVNLR